MDRARKKTDKILDDMERRIAKVYTDSPALRRIQDKYIRYMKMVDDKTKDLYLAYEKEEDLEKKNLLKMQYSEKVQMLTLYSQQYKNIIREFVGILAKENQNALDIVNDNLDEIFVINYNQIAEECRKIGIHVINEGGEEIDGEYE